ncbi:MAG: LysR family transcriptional regulator [Planctomycetota bacterium]|nr:LysR family transcriptional regulator [Planctomycetota bacterium]
MKHRTVPPQSHVLRGRFWVELEGRPVMTDAGADLLDQIAICGSLSEAARRLRFSYRRAWMLLDAMNRGWPKPLVRTSTGGRRGGGTEVTDLGQHVLRSYRDLQLQLEHLLGAAGDPFHTR